MENTTNTTNEPSEAELKQKLESLIKDYPAVTLEDALNDKDFCEMVIASLREEKTLMSLNQKQEEEAKKKSAMDVLKQKLVVEKQQLVNKIQGVQSKPTAPKDMKGWIEERQKIRARGAVSPEFAYADPTFPHWCASWKWLLILFIKKLQQLRMAFPKGEETERKITSVVNTLHFHIEAAVVVLEEQYKLKNPREFRGKYTFEQVETKLYEDEAKYAPYRKLLCEADILIETLNEELKKNAGSPQPAKVNEPPPGQFAPLDANVSPLTGKPVQRPRRSGKKEKRSTKQSATAKPAVPSNEEGNQQAEQS